MLREAEDKVQEGVAVFAQKGPILGILGLPGDDNQEGPVGWVLGVTVVDFLRWSIRSA